MALRQLLSSATPAQEREHGQDIFRVELTIPRRMPVPPRRASYKYVPANKLRADYRAESSFYICAPHLLLFFLSLFACIERTFQGNELNKRENQGTKLGISVYNRKVRDAVNIVETQSRRASMPLK